MQVELHQVGTENRWLLSGPRIRMGRDPECEVVLPHDRYPMVSREHAVLTLDNERMRLTDSQSTNGTFVNGTRISSAMLTRLDRFRLGKDGPEFEVKIVEQQPGTIAPTVLSPDSASSVETAVAADAAAAATRVAQPQDQKTLTRTMGQTTESRRPQETRIGAASLPPQQAPKPKSTRAGDADLQSGSSPEENEMIEQKLNSLRNLVYLLVAMVAVLLGVIFYQSQQIDKNRAELGDMRKQAQSAVAQFTPQLDQRLNAFDKRLDQVDDKMKTAMKDAEDQFMTRLNAELPRMLDKYVDRKMKQLSAAAPQLPTGEK